MALVKYDKVEVRQAEQIVLHDVTLEVNAGDMVYLLGRVGSGKSSLMKTFYAELPVYDGEAHFLEYDLRSKIGVVFQDFQLLMDRNVEENLLFGLRATGWKDNKVMKNHILNILEQVGMQDKVYKMPYQLSGGEQQRVVIARALLNSPEVILADEPTGNLDADTAREIMELLYSISKAGMTVIMSTHNPLWPELFPGRKLVFADGLVRECE